jgi:glycosyltransferase involved in cell wall biosynthesis
MVSVCLALHNGERFLKEQVDSILYQLHNTDELVCSDDGSTDSSVHILEVYQDPRIRVVKSMAKGNHVKNFEHALQTCQGEIIFLADQDDVWSQTKVLTMKSLLNQYDLVVSDCSIINDKGEELSPSIFKLHGSRTGLIKNCIKNTYMGCCMAFNRRVLDRALPFPPQLKAHDQWIGLVAEKYFSVFFLHQQLVKYRRHKNNLSPTGEKSRLSLLEQLSYRIALIKNLSTYPYL